MNNAIDKGTTVNYANSGSAISSGDVVVMKHTLGIAITDIANGASGAVQVAGKVTVPKVTAAVFETGEKLIYDVSAGKFDDSSATPSAGDITGGAVAAAAGANGDTTCRVILTPGNTTVT